MRVKYFSGTDTLLLIFSEKLIAESHDLNENVLIETDKDGHVVSLTVEHAAKHTNVDEFIFQRWA